MPLSDTSKGDDRGFNRPLRVARLIATRSGDPERGPQVALNPAEAARRLLNEGELAWVYGSRRQELAEVRIDPAIGLGDVVLRDIVGAAPSETVRVIKPDLDRAKKPGTGSRAVGQSGSRAVGQSGSRAVGQSGSRAVGAPFLLTDLIRVPLIQRQVRDGGTGFRQ